MNRHQIKTMKLSELKPAEYNPREITKEAMAGLKASLSRFGLVQPIVWNAKTRRIVGGHQRVKALLDAGERDAEVVVVNLAAAEEKALNITLNNPAIEGQFIPNLQDILNDLQQAIPEGFLDLQLDALLHPEERHDKKDQDEIPVIEKPITKPGDLWELGDHRLLCGSSTEGKNVARLMGDCAASCVFTDPPYGVSYEARSGKHKVIKGDDLRDDKLVGLLTPALTLAAKYSTMRAAFYIWHASSTREDFAFAMKAAGIIERQYLIWAKNGFAMGYSDYRWSHEPCFYASKGDKKPAFYGDFTESTIWRVNMSDRGVVATTVGNGILVTDGGGNRLWIQAKPPSNKKIRAARVARGATLLLSSLDSSGTVWEVARDTNTEHPTQKPVELAVRAIENSTKTGEIVYDPFLGSGTTLIGAEVTGRRCYGFELDPKYASVIIKRWERFTDGKAKKI